MGSRGQAGLPQGSADTRLLPAPSLQASAPGSAMDYPLQGLVTHTNYTATLRGLRGPNFTSPASITFTTGVVCEVHGTGWRGEQESQEEPHLHLLFLPLSGLEAPQDLEAKEVTPRTALLTWTAPEVSPTGYLLSFNTPGGQTQVPQALLLRPAPSLDSGPERLPLLLGVGTTSLSFDHPLSVP